MKYTNPVLLSDYSDPDVIRVGNDFYMVASSFNHVPGVPVLHSVNLVDWELINYVLPRLPFERFEKVCHGEGVWAPSIRFHGGKYYCVIPFPDEGIFLSDTVDPYGEWSPLRPLFEGRGYEDPCPIWADGKCYVVFGFIGNRIGFNSKLAVFETDEDMTVSATDYKEIYDGHDIAPIVEGPKFYYRNGYYYILAPAGSVQTGWQIALRSKQIYGEYQTKVIMYQNGTKINGPHQGALIDLDDEGKRWAFMHFQDRGAFGRVVHLQPAVWRNDWVICGKSKDDNLPGEPVEEGDYPVEKTCNSIDPSDHFKGNKLSLLWQTPANIKKDWYALDGGLKLFAVPYAENALSDYPALFMQKIYYENFTVKTRCRLELEDGDEAGFTVFGREYHYICAVRRGQKYFIEVRKGRIRGEQDETLLSREICANEVVFGLKAVHEGHNEIACKFTLDGKVMPVKFYACKGFWVGAKIGVYCRSSSKSQGAATFKYFRVRRQG
ncbi:MAG: glycoside hydrolase 43 family protein [Clostridia bacterium]|nr:glycoside hydrolase 43 family protein [Clostridia bacterium]